MKLNHDFKSKIRQQEWYDLRDDWVLVEASIAKQYGIRIRQHTDMQFTEFCMLISGLMPDTPLGQIVSIRCESDIQTIKSFNADQKRIHNEWKNRQAKAMLQDQKALDKEMENLSAMLKEMFGKKKEVR